MGPPARCVTQRAIRKTAAPDRVNRVMRFRGLRTALVVAIAAAVLAIPTTMALGHTPAKSVSLTRPGAVESGRDFDDHQAQLVSRAPPATPTAPATAAGAAATTASPSAPSYRAPSAPARATAPAFSHLFVAATENTA